MTSETRRQDSRQPAPNSQNAALRGASLAFGKPPVKPKPHISSYAGNNEALAAATKADGGTSRSPSRHPSSSRGEGEEQNLSYQRTGGSNASGYTGDLYRVQQRLSQLDRGGNGFLQLPSPPAVDKSHSPSFIAAALAASRSASVTPNHTGQQQLSAAALRRQLSFTRRSSGQSPGSVRSLSSRGSDEHVLDTSSIPPTTSLIGIFEQNASLQSGKGPGLKTSATSATVRPPPSPKAALQTSSSRTRTPSPTPLITKSSKPEIKSPKPSFVRPILPNANPPKPIAPAQKPSLPTSKPIPIPSKSRSPLTQNDDDDASSDDSFVSASDYKPSWRAALQNQNRRLTSTSATPASMNTIDSLANAIVASSLASSRAASPSKHLPNSNPKPNTLFPPPPPPRRSPHKHLFHNTKESRTPSPAKQGVLRTTMRKERREEEDEGDARRKKKAHLMKKHPNKHHEGDRKRWRDEVTERERKRYEAVWASNRGLFMESGMEGSVCSLVVRDIFSRSRLHTDVLEEVYALVDKKGLGSLGREEFVVGLWLVDQRLKGRKLPPKVSPSVWKSVAILSDIKVKKFGK